MAGPSRDDRPPLAVAMEKAQQVTAIALEMAVPAGLGYWLDGKWGTGPWLVSVGAVIGFVVAMSHLLQLAKSAGSKRGNADQNNPNRHE